MHRYEITDGPDKGLELPFTAEYSGNLAATLVLPLGGGGIYWRTDYSYMDAYFLAEPLTYGATVRYDF